MEGKDSVAPKMKFLCLPGAYGSAEVRAVAVLRVTITL